MYNKSNSIKDEAERIRSNEEKINEEQENEIESPRNNPFQINSRISIIPKQNNRAQTVNHKLRKNLNSNDHDLSSPTKSAQRGDLQSPTDQKEE